MGRVIRGMESLRIHWTVRRSSEGPVQEAHLMKRKSGKNRHRKLDNKQETGKDKSIVRSNRIREKRKPKTRQEKEKRTVVGFSQATDASSCG